MPDGGQLRQWELAVGSRQTGEGMVQIGQRLRGGIGQVNLRGMGPRRNLGPISARGAAAKCSAPVDGGPVTLGEGFEPPPVADRFDDGGVVQGLLCPEDRARVDPRRDQDRRDAHAQTVESETLRTGHLGTTSGRDRRRGSDVVITTPVLIVGHNQQRAFPEGTLAHRLIDLMYQILTRQHAVGWVLVIVGDQEARLDERVGREFTGGRVFEKMLSNERFSSIKTTIWSIRSRALSMACIDARFQSPVRAPHPEHTVTLRSTASNRTPLEMAQSPTYPKPFKYRASWRRRG